MSNLWQSLPDCPIKLGYDTLSQMNVGTYSELYVASRENGVYKYQTGEENKWSKVFDYPSTFKVYRQASTLNQTNHSIYFGTFKPKFFQLFKFDLNSKSFTELCEIQHKYKPKFICINNKIHIFGRYHGIFNIKTNEFSQIHKFADKYPYWVYQNPRIIFHIKSTNSILMIHADGTIYEYSLNNDKWTKWGIKIPSDDASTVTLTNDERFMIIFSGWADRIGERSPDKIMFRNKIFIYDFRMKKIMESKIKSPSDNRFYKHSLCTSTRNELAEELLVFGYVKAIYKSTNFKHIQELPVYLIKFIGKWISIEFIHFINRDKLKHWRISVDSILENAE